KDPMGRICFASSPDNADIFGQRCEFAFKQFLFTITLYGFPGTNLFAVRSLPQSDRPVLITACQQTPIGAPGKSSNRLSLLPENMQLTTARRFPEPDKSGLVPACHEPSIRAESKRSDGSTALPGRFQQVLVFVEPYLLSAS